MAGKLIVGPIQINDNVTTTNNFHFATDNAGGLVLYRGNVGTTTTPLLAVDSSGNVQLTKATTQSMVRLNTANGYGSTNTVIRRFTNIVTNQGSDITYADSATLGASFIINTDGVYALESHHQANTASSDFGISLNATALTTGISSTASPIRLCMSSTPAANQSFFTGTTLYLPAGSVIRVHTNGAPSGTLPDRETFTITRVA